MRTVLVVGGGVYGACSALYLALRKFQVTWIDARDRVAPDRSSSGGMSRSWIPPYLSCYEGLMGPAEAAYRSLEELTGNTLLELTGALEIGEPGYSRFGDLRAELTANSAPFDFWDEGKVRKRFPKLRRPVAGALHRRDAGIIHPHRLIEGVSQLALARDVTFYPGVVFHGANEVPKGIHADIEEKSGGGRVTKRFDHVLLTTGAWTTPLLAKLIGRKAPTFATDDTYGVYRAERRATPLGGFSVVTYHGAERMGFALSVENLNEVKIFPRDGIRPFDPAIEAPVHDDGSLALCETFLGDLDSEAGWKKVRSAICTYELVSDGRPTVGRLPGFDRFWTANSCPGGGMKFAPLMAELVAEAIDTEVISPVLERFWAGRFAAV